ncbi:MAG: type II toxin-antitoxin system RelE/ParE family toxin [Parcubacteria group bacterium]|nr:type II toxin-antitoxin system RelE/ParE family toxin [Parcubacteria group bacterium]
MAFKVYTTSSFDRESKKAVSKNSKLLAAFSKIVAVLSLDPFNLKREHNIKKLADVDYGKWRLRLGDYRIRYDVDGSRVILHSIRNRKDAYK